MKCKCLWRWSLQILRGVDGLVVQSLVQWVIGKLKHILLSAGIFHKHCHCWWVHCTIFCLTSCKQWRVISLSLLLCFHPRRLSFVLKNCFFFSRAKLGSHHHRGSSYLFTGLWADFWSFWARYWCHTQQYTQNTASEGIRYGYHHGPQAEWKEVNSRGYRGCT